MAQNKIEIIINAQDNASRTVGGLHKAFGGLGNIIQTGLGTALGFLTAQAIPQVLSGLRELTLGSIEASSDLSESLNKVRVVFGDSAQAIEDFALTAATNLGLSNQQALEAAGTFGNLFTAMGIGQNTSAEMSESLLTLAADLASFNNIDPSVALEKLRAGLVGEVEPLRTLGVNLNALAVEAKAVELGLIKDGGELTAAAKAQAAYALILEQTTNAQGDFARTSTGLANAQRIFQAQMKDVKAELGQGFLPIMQTLMNKVILPLLPRIKELAGNFSNLMGVLFDAGFVSIEFREALGLLIGDDNAAKVMAIAEGFQTLWKGLQNASNILREGDIGGAFDAIGQALFDLTGNSAIAEFFYNLGSWTENAAEKLGILYGWARDFVSKIDWEGIRDTIINIFDSIANAVQVITTGDFKGGIFGLTEDHPAITALLKLHDAIEGLSQGGQRLLDSINWDEIGNIIGGTFQAISDALSRIDWQAIRETIGGAFERIHVAMSKIDWETIGKAAVEVWDVIKAAVEEAVAIIVDEAWPQLVAAFDEFKQILLDAGVDWEALKTAATIAVGLIVAVILTLIATITGLVVGIAAAVKTISEHFESVRAKSQQIWENIGEIIQNAVALFKAIVEGDWTQAWELFKKGVGLAFDTIKTFISTFVEIIATNFDAVIKLVEGFVNTFIEFFQNLYDRLIGHSIIPDLINDILAIFTGTNWLEVGQNIVEGIASGISAGIQWVKDAAIAVAKAALQAAKDLLGINSESDVAADVIGKNFDLGVAKGIGENARSTFAASAVVSAALPATMAAAPVPTSGTATASSGVIQNITNNIFNPAAMAMALDEQRRASSRNLNASAGR